MEYYHKFCVAVQRILKVLTAVIVAAMLILMLVEVVRRYLFNRTWIWSDETIRIGLIYTAFLGGAVAYGQGRMINFDIIYTKLPQRSRALTSLFVSIVSQLFLVFVFVLSIKKLLNPSMSTQISPNTGLPIYVTYLCIPISMGSCFLFGVDQILALIRNMRERLRGRRSEGGVSAK